MLLKRDAEGTVKEVTDGKVVVYAQGVDTTGTETKGTVLIKSAEELENYSRWVGRGQGVGRGFRGGGEAEGEGR